MSLSELQARAASGARPFPLRSTALNSTVDRSLASARTSNERPGRVLSDDASNRVLGSMAAAICATIDWITSSPGASGDRASMTASRSESCDEEDQIMMIDLRLETSHGRSEH